MWGVMLGALLALTLRDRPAGPASSATEAWNQEDTARLLFTVAALVLGTLAVLSWPLVIIAWLVFLG